MILKSSECILNATTKTTRRRGLVAPDVVKTLQETVYLTQNAIQAVTLALRDLTFAPSQQAEKLPFLTRALDRVA